MPTQKSVKQARTTGRQAALLGSSLLYAAIVSHSANAQPGAGVMASERAVPRGEEIIVTANRLPQLQNETMAATSVITREHIDARQAGSLFELLGASAGIQTARTGGEGSQTSLFMRGTNSDHTLVLIDGIKVNTASEGFARLEHLPVDQIERIEIVRGPHSSVHGADALGGVIQIFTRQSQAGADTDGIRGELRGGFGTENTSTFNAGVSAGSANTTLGLNFSHYSTDGIRPRNAPTPSEQRGAYDNDAATVNLSHVLGNGTVLNAHATLADSELGFDGGTGEGRHISTGAVATVPITNNWASQLRISRFRDTNDTFSAASSDSRSRTTREALNWQNHLAIAEREDLVFGLDYEDEELLYSTDMAQQTDTRRDNLAVFGVYNRGMGALDATLSVRRDRNEQFGGKTTGRVAVGSDVTDELTVWAAYSTAFKAPKLLDLYVDFPAFFFFANPELQPETAENMEVGLNATWLNSYWTASVFRNNVRNLIATNDSFDSLTNIGRARINGAEVTASTQLFGWTANAALTLLDHENRATGEALLRRPDELFTLGLNRQFDQLNVNAQWRVRGSQYDVDPVTFGRSEVAGSGVVDLALSWAFTTQFSAQLKIGNLFDKDYQVVDGFNTHGTTALLSARYQF